ncbi:PREDICTED: sin3 histone deacetylase corepressor complex component SDS3 [Nicrophorus vespilloides]|uniref:Sin3 histone deacetylase corepressor complex component SDS3 n=1 Tax=Nicrophorus vespilloides TaxID=110193 RepID=A0ABM1MM06_NICVS|nr:PREDICTED: sin3 histone deacetylase corepressor complex component SDS3 [Nicrophorus vespilloides]
MSYVGSPYSNTFHQEDYDLDDDHYDDDNDKEREHDNESDEDTEDASETDTGPHEEHMEIKEQMYQDKLATLKKKLQQLEDGTHYEYTRKVKKLNEQYEERNRLNNIYREYMMECVERDYIIEKKAAVKEYEEKKVELKENLISDFEDKRKTIEAERFTMELTGDSMEVKPVMTRKLRRRPNDPVPVPEKRRKPPAAQITYLLEEKEVESDLKKIAQPYKKPVPEIVANANSNSSSQNQSMQVSSTVNDAPPVVETRVEDGKLLYERRWYHRGQSIFVEGRDMAKFPASISAIANDAICVKKSDNSKVRIYITNLARGKVSIKRRAS